MWMMIDNGLQTMSRCEVLVAFSHVSLIEHPVFRERIVRVLGVNVIPQYDAHPIAGVSSC
jgi:hypothetical protein